MVRTLLTQSPAHSNFSLVVELIQQFSINEISPREFNTSIPIPVTWEMSTGINVTVNVTYNGIPCCDAGPLTNTTGRCDCLISNPNLFDPDGVVSISATAWNQVSYQEKSINVKVMSSIFMVDPWWNMCFICYLFSSLRLRPVTLRCENP